MDERTVRSLEKAIEKEILDVLCRMGLKRLPLMPSQQTMHLMAKAATSVYEAAVENWTNAGLTPPRESGIRPNADSPDDPP
jgi:hypothetical protein